MPTERKVGYGGHPTSSGSARRPTPFQLDKRSSLRHCQQLSTPNATTVHLMPWIGMFLQEERYFFTSTQIPMVEALVIPDDGE